MRGSLQTLDLFQSSTTFRTWNKNSSLQNHTFVPRYEIHCLQAAGKTKDPEKFPACDRMSTHTLPTLRLHHVSNSLAKQFNIHNVGFKTLVCSLIRWADFRKYNYSIYKLKRGERIGY